MAATQEKCDVADSWEDIDEPELLDSTFPQRSTTITLNGPVALNGPIVVQEDTLRTQYAPPEPSVKILKRPSREEVCSEGVNGDAGRRDNRRTLQQRQIDYAQARLRILGQAKSPEDELDDRLRELTMLPTAPSPSSIVSSHSTLTGPVTLLRPSDPVTLLRPSHHDSPTPPRLSEPVTLLRSPRGPDGSRGFNVRR